MCGFPTGPSWRRARAIGSTSVPRPAARARSPTRSEPHSSSYRTIRRSQPYHDECRRAMMRNLPTLGFKSKGPNPSAIAVNTRFVRHVACSPFTFAELDKGTGCENNDYGLPAAWYCCLLCILRQSTKELSLCAAIYLLVRRSIASQCIEIALSISMRAKSWNMAAGSLQPER